MTEPLTALGGYQNAGGLGAVGASLPPYQTRVTNRSSATFGVHIQPRTMGVGAGRLYALYLCPHLKVRTVLGRTVFVEAGNTDISNEARTDVKMQTNNYFIVASEHGITIQVWNMQRTPSFHSRNWVSCNMSRETTPSQSRPAVEANKPLEN